MQNRYSRQTQVKQIGDAGQRAISKARILIVGAGGLGCTVAPFLTGAGVSDITIVDHDTVDESNLHRQLLYRESDIGQCKAKVAAREIKQINRHCQVTAINQRLSVGNVNELCKDMDVVIDAADNFIVSYLLSDACESFSIPLVSASVNATFGYVGQFCCNSPSLKDAFPRIPKEQTSCDLVGVTGPSVGVIGSLQAQEVLKVLVNDPSQLKGKLLYIDAWNYSQQIIDLSGMPKRNAFSLTLICVAELRQSQILLDVRNPDEIKSAPYDFPTTIHIPLSQLQSRLKELPLDKDIVCVCKSGQRALSAAQILIDAGFKNIKALTPG